MSVKRKTMLEIICFAFFILFVYTAMSKLMKFDRYIWDLGRSPLLGPIKWPVAILIPGSELVISVMLLLESSRRKGLIAALVLMILFTIYVFYAIYIAHDTPCTCGGIIRELTWRQHLIFNLCFTALAWIGIKLMKPESQSKSYYGVHN